MTIAGKLQMRSKVFGHLSFFHSEKYAALIHPQPPCNLSECQLNGNKLEKQHFDAAGKTAYLRVFIPER
jgi:hypothetical protein